MTQLQAIIGSCLKWWRIRYQGGRNGGASDCPLCQHAGMKYGIVQCSNCLIKKKTRLSGCKDTPYTIYRWNETNGHALDELQFLFDLIKPRYYENTRKELTKGKYPKKFVTWMERAIYKAEEAK